MTIQLVLVLSVLGQPLGHSPFNVYAAHVEPRALDGRCMFGNPAYFRDLTYTFRAKAYPRDQPVRLRDSRHDDPAGWHEGGTHWSMELEEQSVIYLNGERAVLLKFVAIHLTGSGSASHVLIVRCVGERLQVVFEAGGEGVRASYSGTGGVQVSYPHWRDNDSHAAPSRVIEERYRWKPGRGRFGLVDRRETVPRARRRQD